MTELFLDLHEVEIYGWEEYKSKTLVDSILRGIASGDSFPPVAVIQYSGFYALDFWTYDDRFSQSDRRDGGHTRSIAHYLSHKPLRCLLTGVTNLSSPPKYSLFIKDIIVTDSYGEENGLFGKVDLKYAALRKMACDSRYR